MLKRGFKNKNSFPGNNWLTDFILLCNTVAPLLERGVFALRYSVLIEVILNFTVKQIGALVTVGEF
jgi:hypothetical protein